jgi:hypothetical protein
MSDVTVYQPNNAEIYRSSTDAASLCREIVLKTAMEIQGRKYVKVEGWQAIAIAHGCTGSARDVEVVEGGVRAIGEIRRMNDGAIIAQAEGFVGEDEPVWYGGEAVNKWGKVTVHQKRPAYAIRAMAQTRAISRACRSAFAHVVVLIDANLSTTPAEEVPLGGFDEMRDVTPHSASNAAQDDSWGQEEPADVAAANVTIDALKTEADCARWWKDNVAIIKTSSQQSRDAICLRLKNHKAMLAANAPEIIIEQEAA